MIVVVFSVSVLSEEWCWQERAVEMEVVDKEVTDLAFKHTGYILACSLSHDITLVRNNIIPSLVAGFHF